MQISMQEVHNARRIAEAARREAVAAPVASVQDLAARHGVSMDEVRRFTGRAMVAEQDLSRERRVQELAKRVAAGNYRLESEQVVEMAERRALADRAAQL